MNPFDRLKKMSLDTTLLHSINALLEWDQETFIPSEAIAARSMQIELLSGLVHKNKTSAAFKKALLSFTGVSLQEKAAEREWKHEYFKEAKLSSSFVKLFAKTTSNALSVWAEAKKKKDFSLFAPHLTKIVALSQKKAKLLGYEEHPYDALLDYYEPGLTVSTLVPLFDRLKKALLEILHKRRSYPVSVIGTFSKEKQLELGRLILELMGLPPTHVRLDTSVHPFCVAMHPTDIRTTTRIHEDNPLNSLSSVLHEGGHALYQLQLPQEYYGTPLCEPVSYGVDESQSRLWETIIGKGLPFWTFFYPKLQQVFPQSFNSIPLASFYQWVNTIEPGCIRVDADEVTYCLHIVLRFEIEKDLMEGTIKVKDIPKIWNKKMQELLSITPSHDGEGCLQDVHWAMGGIGYFPTYAIGNLLAAQLFATWKKQEPKGEEAIAQGDFSLLREWLGKNIHSHGKMYRAKELIQQVTGAPLGIECYINYLKNKYENI